MDPSSRAPLRPPIASIPPSKKSASIKRPAVRTDCETEAKQVWSLVKLKPHPRQRTMFPDRTGESYRRLRDSLRDEGQREPIEILPDGTIISGHQRVRAATELGWEVIVVIVRADLAGDASEAERRLIEVNLQGRQLTMLDQVRATARLFELSGQAHNGADPVGHIIKTLVDKYAAKKAPSRKHVQRLLNILTLDLALQVAVDHKQITIVDGSELAKMPKSVHEEVLRALQRGESAAKVIRKHTSAKKDNGKDLIKDTLWNCGCRVATLLDEQSDWLPFSESVKLLVDTCNQYLKIAKKAKSTRKEVQQFRRQLKRR